MSQTKQCKSCGEIKLINEFTKNKIYKDGYQPKCRKCINEFRKRYTLTCENCGKSFRSDIKERKYCSISCSNKGRSPSIKSKCDICGEEIDIIQSKLKINNHHYCSIECSNKGRKVFCSGENSPLYFRIQVNCSECNKNIYINEYRYKKLKYFYCSRECKANHQKELFKGELGPFYGKKHSENAKKLISIKRYGKPAYNKGKKMSEEQKIKLRMSWTEERKREWGRKVLGENNPCYNPNLSDNDRNNRRLLFGYSSWRILVYAKDDYTCQCCGDNSGGNLNAHHLDSYDWCKEKRIEVDNGMTLCEKCHKEFHLTYGYGGNTREQMNDFLDKKRV